MKWKSERSNNEINKMYTYIGYHMILQLVYFENVVFYLQS